jgi:dipeptidyl aminopeptidase/acylaminoacyl peptidase
MGQRVELGTARTVGDPFVIAEGVEYLFTSSRAMFSAARTGTIAYHTGGELLQPMWVDQQGNELGTVGSAADYDPQSVRLSADGSMLLSARRQDGFGTIDIWRLDLFRNTEERVTSDRGSEVTPVLAADGRTMYFAADRRGGVPNLFRRDLATGAEEPLQQSGLQQLAMDVIPGDGAVVYVQRSKHMTYDIYRSPRGGATPAIPLVESRLDKYDARVAPDGRAIAFAAIDGTRLDVYVAPLPITSAPIVAASDVGGPPRWSRDNRRVYFQDRSGRVLTIPVDTGPPLVVGRPQMLFESKRPAVLSDVAADGRLLMLVRLVRAGQRPIAVATAAVRPD